MPILSHTLEEIDAGTPRGTRVKITCDLCEIVFERKAKLLRGDRKRGRTQSKLFCSSVCRDKANVTSLPKSLTCTQCNKIFEGERDEGSINVFCGRACSAVFNNKLRPKPEKAIKVKISRAKLVKHTLKCEGCGSSVLRTDNQLRQMKHGKPYCSKSCRMKHYNANILERTSNQRSRAEDILANLIKADFPDLEVSVNNRQILPSRLELDIYLPTAKLAIELNGPVHYFPIYGEERLTKVQVRDSQKHKETQELDIGLLILDISNLQTIKKTVSFLTEHYTQTIKPLIMGTRVGVTPTIA